MAVGYSQLLQASHGYEKVPSLPEETMLAGFLTWLFTSSKEQSKSSEQVGQQEGDLYNIT